MITSKYCRKCETTKSVSEFSQRISNGKVKRAIYQAYCKSCSAVFVKNFAITPNGHRCYPDELAGMKQAVEIRKLFCHHL